MTSRPAQGKNNKTYSSLAFVINPDAILEAKEEIKSMEMWDRMNEITK